MTWIFGYGSLMWRPGFDHLERRPALLAGYHRAFCRYSHRHRGTPERPGLVMGLREDAEGSGTCIGVAFRVDPAREAAILAVLDGREGDGYLRLRQPVRLLDGDPEGPAPSVPAWVYVPNPAHPSYFGQASREAIVTLVRQGRGESGTALDYMRELVRQLDALGVKEPELRAVLRDVEAQETG